MKLKGWLIVSGALVLVIAGTWGGKRWHDYYKYTPKLNPHPRYFVTVKGRVDPRLDKALKIQWAASYLTTNPKCVVYGAGGRFEGATASRTRNITYSPVFGENGQFSLKIPIDGYRSGYCRWKLGGMFYKFSYKNFHQIADVNTAFEFGDTKKTWDKPIHQEWLCSVGNCILSSTSTTYVDHSLNLNNDYTITLNFKELKND